MKNRQYQGVQLSKKESELIQWLQKGEHDWFQAFYVYKDRSKVTTASGLKQRSWFNRTLMMLHNKGLCKNIPFVMNGIKWRNPGITCDKANFVALTLQETNVQNTQELNRIL